MNCKLIPVIPFSSVTLVCFIAGVFLFAGSLIAQNAKIAHLTDEGSAVAGERIVYDYHGALPQATAKDRVIDQMPGWPKTMASILNFTPNRGLVFADLNNDGTLEIVTSSTDSKIYAWDYTGAAMPGFPKSTIGWCQSPPSVADLDADGDMEIAQLTRGQTSGGRIYLVDHEGNTLPGFPISLNNNNLSSSPAFYDLDNDGIMEIVVAERAYPIGYLHIFEIDGTEWGGRWPVALDHVPTCTAAVGDVDHDGSPEIVYMSYNSIYVLDTDGLPLSGWPKQIPNANFSYQSPALADLDNDSDLEIVVGAHKDAPGCYIFHHDGTAFPGWPKITDTWTYCPPTVADLEGDGALEILDGQAGFGPGMFSRCFYVWTSQGASKPGFPYTQSQGGGTEGPISVIDIDNDGIMEIFADYNIKDGANLGYVFGVDAAGQDLPGFPLRPTGFTYMNGTTFGDVDGDGDIELGVLSVQDTLVYVNLYDLEGEWHPSQVAWETYHKKNARGGLYKSEDKLNFQGYFGTPSSVTIYLHDDPGYKAFLWASLGADMGYTFNYGWFYLSFNPILLTILFNATLPASGELALGVDIPDDPALEGVTLFLQGLTGVDPAAGDGRLTNMLARTIQ
ncbi:MAG: VCBS repeat-containing protein [Planctomycetota bacterium]